MSRDSSRVPASSRPQPARHQFEHEAPVHIHDPEEDMMLLARWFHRALQNPTRFWGTVAAIVASILGIVMIWNMSSLGSSSNQEVWSKLELAKTPAERVTLAEDNPQSPASTWARLQAATEYYNQGFADLPSNRDVALPTLKKALDNFDAVTKTAPAASPEARAAAIGKARTLEARNELSKAIDQYQLVAKTWPGTVEAREAEQMAAALQKPEAASFYKDLYAFAPPKVTLPPGGTQNLDFPLVPAPPGVTTPPGMPASIPLLPPPPALPVTIKEEAKPKAATEKDKAATPSPTGTLPEVPIAPGTAATPASQPAPTAAKPAAPAPAPKPAEPAAPKSKS